MSPGRTIGTPSDLEASPDRVSGRGRGNSRPRPPPRTADTPQSEQQIEARTADPLRILMLSDYYPPHAGGGVEKVVSELAVRLARRGHRVHVLTLHTCESPATEALQGVTVQRAAALDLTGRVGFQFAISAHVLPAIIRSVRSFRPDVVHAHNLFFRTTEVAALSGVWDRTPLVTTVHLGRMEGGAGPLSLLTSLYEGTVGRLVLRASDHVTAVSAAAARHAHRLAGASKPITVIANGVDAGMFHPSPAGGAGPPVVLSVGRLIANKGPLALLRAAPAILARHRQARFLYAGDGPLRRRLEASASELGIAHAVEFLGQRDDVPELMRKASVFVRASTLEGLPLTVLEAMASGLPVVATAVGGTPEVVRDGVSGYLVPPDDEAALATAVARVLDDPDRAAAMGSEGRRAVEKGYSWDRVVQQTERVYRETIRT